VASQNGVAATVGAEILAAGGSAVDAVVAAAFALAVREPWNSGLGGIGFMVVQPPGGARAEIVDFGPIAPAGLDTASYALTGETITELFTWPRVEGDRNMHGPLSFAIPSAVRGYALAVERFGRTPWRDLGAAAGGVLSAADLAECRARIVPSLEIAYRSYALQAARGLTAAPTLADVIDRLSSKRFPQAPDAVYFETLIDALQQAYHARLEGLGDVRPQGSDDGCTTHITAIDREGGIAALTTTLLSSFGSRYVLPQTGILMNNGIMWFDPRPGRPNSIGPGKRALTN